MIRSCDADGNPRIVGGGSMRANRPDNDVSRDGRFLINQPVEEASLTPITLILNPNLEGRRVSARACRVEASPAKA